MKLLRFEKNGEEKPGVLDREGNIRDISSIIRDINPCSLMDSDDFIKKMESYDIKNLPVVEKKVRIAPCLGWVGKIVCIGYNSRLHALEMGKFLSESEEIMFFLKASSSTCGANDDILYSQYVSKMDWEAELGVVIGKKGKYIEKEHALEYVLGYTCVNDISERCWQFEKEDKQYTKGKSFDTFAPIGPYIVTKNEINDPSDLHVTLYVNDELRQDFRTSDYIHGVEEVISYLSRFFTLYPGDIIAMGSAPGNAKFWGEDKFLKPGDKMVFSIDGLGEQRQMVVKE